MYEFDPLRKMAGICSCRNRKIYDELAGRKERFTRNDRLARKAWPARAARPAMGQAQTRARPARLRPLRRSLRSIRLFRLFRAALFPSQKTAPLRWRHLPGYRRQFFFGHYLVCKIAAGAAECKSNWGRNGRRRLWQYSLDDP